MEEKEILTQYEKILVGINVVFEQHRKSIDNLCADVQFAIEQIHLRLKKLETEDDPS